MRFSVGGIGGACPQAADGGGRGFAGPLPLAHALGVAIEAFHEVNVVRTLGILEGGLHGLNVQAAVGHAWMALQAGSASGLAMLLVAGQATDTLMNADGRALGRGPVGGARETREFDAS